MLALMSILLIGSTLLIFAESRRERDRVMLRQHFLQTILNNGFRYDRQTKHIISFNSRLSKEIASEVIARLTMMIYNIDESPLLQLDRSLHLSGYLLSSAKETRGYRRARYLALLANSPAESISIADVEPFKMDRNRMVRFLVLATKINIDRDNFAHHIASYDEHMTPFELAYIIDRIRQGELKVAYHPLLSSHSHNLNLLGLSIVRLFEIGSAEDLLLEFITKKQSIELRTEALYTLASMRLDISGPEVRLLLRDLNRATRAHFMRYCAREGYCESVINSVATEQERGLFHSISNRYKIKIECC